MEKASIFGFSNIETLSHKMRDNDIRLKMKIMGTVATIQMYTLSTYLQSQIKIY